jgi:hypothetical protein
MSFGNDGIVTPWNNHRWRMDWVEKVIILLYDKIVFGEKFLLWPLGGKILRAVIQIL